MAAVMRRSISLLIPYLERARALAVEAGLDPRRKNRSSGAAAEAGVVHVSRRRSQRARGGRSCRGRSDIAAAGLGIPECTAEGIRRSARTRSLAGWRRGPHQLRTALTPRSG